MPNISRSKNWALIVWNVLKFVFIVWPSQDLQIYLKTKMLTTLFLPYIKLFQKIKRDLELASCVIFWIIFEEKYFSRYILLIDQISLPNCLNCLRYLGNMSIVIMCFQLCKVIHFEINLSLFIKFFSYMPKESGQKCKYL